jgi:thiol-disulfide isomerase/thioredoxin
MSTRRQILSAGLAATGASLGIGSVQAAYLVRAWEPGKAVPKLELNDLAGKPWSLAALRGQVVVMNFWATWCEPCRAEMPSLELLAQRHERDDVTVVAINYQEPLPAIRRFLDAQPLTLPILLDRDGAATTAWTPRVFPSTVLIDRKRATAEHRAGELD